MIFFYAGIALIVLEIAVFGAVADAIGFFSALFLCFAAGAVGVILVQREGLGLLTRLRASLDQGLMPMNEMFDAACLMAAGILMIFPGFTSDMLGLALLIPQIRNHLRVFFARRYGKEDGNFNPDTGVIEGDFIRVREDVIPPPEGGPR